MSQSSVDSLFPDSEQFGLFFYREAVRHLEDALVLYQGGRWAGAMTSAMKAEELGVKAALILDNLVGFYDKVYGTHKPITDLELDRTALFRRLNIALDQERPGLVADLQSMEILEPNLFGKREYGPNEANTEYPYLMRQPGARRFNVVRLHSPAVDFGEPDALRFYRLAREVVEVLARLYSVIGSWAVALPAVL